MQPREKPISAMLKLENGPSIAMQIYYTDVPEGERLVWSISPSDGMLLEQFVKMRALGVGDANTAIVV